MSDQDLRKVTELLREIESEEREKVMEAAEQNLLDSLKSVENITKAIDQLVIKETKRRHDFKDLLTTIKSIVVKSKKRNYRWNCRNRKERQQALISSNS
jgi:CRISPR/Cas system-associated endonuclease Cas3-HD